MSADDSVAIAIVLEHYDVGEGVSWPPFDVENVWALSLGEPYFEVRSIPFYAANLNVGDVVEARPREGFSDPVVASVVRRSGNWTVHIVVMDGASDAAQKLLDRACELGCTVDHDDTTGIVAMSIPPALASETVFALLETGERESTWDVEISSGPV
ncbi:MAG: DUF4265 domain-containing protein [Vulcanimicrobiaceae bacterium]